jgi:hypothetical protein
VQDFELFSTSIRIPGEASSAMDADVSRTFVVFGVPRGGTTMVARIVEQLGVPMGQELPANYEDQAFNFDFMPDEFKADRSKMRASLIDSINQRNQHYSIWGWKYPRANIYLNQILEHVRRPHLICVLRDPLASSMRPLGRKNFRAKSGKISSPLKLIEQHLAWQNRNLEIIRKSKCPSLICSYEKAIISPVEFVKEMADFIGLDSSSDRISFAADQIKPGSYIQG